MPSCKIAQATLAALSPPQQKSPANALFVDNIAFFGSEGSTTADMQSFKERANSCGALINHEDNGYRKVYDFLGEHYDHGQKTRALTEKAAMKMHTIIEVVDAISTKGGKTKCRQVMAIIGSLMYAANVLDIRISEYQYALRAYTRIAVEASTIGEWDFSCILESISCGELRAWAAVAAKNIPVHVVSGQRTPTCPDENVATTTLWVDASRWGWGAIIAEPGKTLRRISTAWTVQDEEAAAATGGHLASSVTAEPMALRKALCAVTPHLATREENRWSNVTPYNDAFRLVEDFRGPGIDVAVGFVPGIANPADPLSRGKPPLLNVSKIGPPPPYNSCG